MAASRKIRYAVVGPGHIAQVAVLPAFAHAKSNSELGALISDDPVRGLQTAFTMILTGVALATGLLVSRLMVPRRRLLK